MKLTKEQLKRIIKEELKLVMQEEELEEEGYVKKSGSEEEYQQGIKGQGKQFTGFDNDKEEEAGDGTLSAQFAAGKTPVATDDFQNLAQEEDPED
tara:strand:- start:31 stop:315 length:285 start_codon:yes stop_codon:yes gene_type:complete